MSTDRRDPSEALTVTEAARRLGVSPRTLKRWSARELEYFRVGPGRHRRYRPGEVDRYIRERTLDL